MSNSRSKVSFKPGAFKKIDSQLSDISTSIIIEDKRYEIIDAIVDRADSCKATSQVLLCKPSTSINPKDLCVVKQVKMNHSDRDQLINELHILKKVQSSNIIKLISYKEAPDHIWMTMEYCPCSLMEYIKDNRPCKSYITHAFLSMVKAVSQLHTNKIIHLDLKPQNFVFNSLLRLKLIDFGIAKQIKPGSTHILSDDFVGTLLFMSPEQIIQDQNKQFEIGLASDIWSLGVILYFMESNCDYPFVNKDQKALARMIVENKLEIPDGFRTHIKRLITKCLQTKDDKRPSASELFIDVSTSISKPKPSEFL